MLKSYLDRLDMFLFCLINGAREDERGDTNFISILILLGVAIGLATIFIGFKDQIVKMVQDIIDNFTL